ncbi:MAG TPA: dipeptide/oligopeptide/nickel ABC transporter ATP-binding protein [Lentisphaeria bacterium]|nr:MAG: dipeptide/oligopeptide/nickel ABC transporter ATP-binding protein [Lentisphaerae bacterium GWF2_38_69]HBM17348.1 dipeptide/oligopeptide/nickel ABC transporter ATP-binding protein [Lentisphaeria bacterium]
MSNLLSIKNLSLSFKSYRKTYHALRGISFDISEGETLGIVGESGAGKSVTFYSMLGLIPKSRNVTISGEAVFNGTDLLSLPEKDLLKIRGRSISIIFQDPMTSLNPYIKVGNQIIEALCIHTKIPRKTAMQEAMKMLNEVGIREPEKRFYQYPHEFSGGMRQRIMISMALITKPKLLIADEPTTALDVTVQSQILKLIKKLKSEHNMSIAFITHDLGIVAELCDNVCVMYAGTIVEKASVMDLFYNSKHPYTISLKKSLPSITETKETLYSIPGIPPDNSFEIKGCPFAPRCYMAKDECFVTDVFLRKTGENHFSSCLFSDSL